jgi:hypothetical protein
MKYYEEVWSFKYQVFAQARPSRTVQQHFWFQEVAFEAQRVIVRMLSKKANVLTSEGLSE